MLAASLNYRDLLMVRGSYDRRASMPLIPCSDGVGVVEAVGEGCSLKVGQRVAGLFCQSWMAGNPPVGLTRTTLGGPLPGMLRTHAVLPEKGVIEVPHYLSDAEAATLPCAALTAWSALVTYGHTGPGDAVLTLGTGGVSLFAVQFALLCGARVLSTTSSTEKAERLRDMGVEEVFDYLEEPTWGRAARKHVGAGVDHVVEVGGAGTLGQSLDAVRPGGTVSMIGVLAASEQPLSVLPVLMKQIRVQGIFVGHRQGFRAMNRALSTSGLRPVVDRIFDWGEVPAAFDYLASGQHFGKVVVRVT